MTNGGISRRKFGVAFTAAMTGIALPALWTRRAHAADSVRFGIQIGALGTLRSTLSPVGQKFDLTFDVKDFRDSTSALLALEQRDLDICNTTAQHLIRAISEGIPVKWVCGWGGGYNVLVSRKGIDVKPGDGASLKALALSRKQAGKPLIIGVPTGSMQHAKLSIYLRSLHIDPNKDVQVANIAFPNHPRALEAGEVDFAMTLAAFGALAIVNGDAVLFLHLFGGKFGKQEIGFIVHQKLVQEKPELVQRIVNTNVDAMKMFMGQPDKQIELERKYSRLPDKVIVMQERDFLHYNFRTNIADIKTMARELHQLGWVKEDYGSKIDSFVDFSFVAKASGLTPAELSSW